MVAGVGTFNVDQPEGENIGSNKPLRYERPLQSIASAGSSRRKDIDDTCIQLRWGFRLAFMVQIGPSALAADGPVVITQATSQAGGVTKGDKPGFPVSITRSGSYELGSSLQPPAGVSGIVVSAPNVTIDLKGFALEGRDTAKHGVVVRGRPGRSVEVRNGSITGFAGSAIYGPTLTVGVFQNLRIHWNGDGIRTAHHGRIMNNSIIANVGAGVLCGNFCHVEGNIVAENQQGGISVDSGNVLGNVIEQNEEFGIKATFFAGAANNSLWWNGDGGQLVNISAMQPNFCEPTCDYADLSP
jgi:hypothetical protein